MIRRPRLILALSAATLVGAALWAGARTSTESITRPDLLPSASPEARGASAFRGASFGGVSMAALSTNAVPWRLVAAALVLDERQRDPTAPVDQATLNRVLARFGFLTAARVVNQPSSVPQTPFPLGFTAGDIAPVGGLRIRVANLGCAACHAGVTYAADGSPRPDQAMLGMPNSSIDLEAYTMAIFRAMRRHSNGDELLAAVDQLFPDMGHSERLTLRVLVLPLARRRLAELANVDRPMPFPNGAPGSTNGVAALKAALHQPLLGGGIDDAGVVSIPDLGDRVWKSSLLVDGAYAVPGRPRQATTTAADLGADHLRALATITTFFTVPSMGVHPDRAVRNLDDATAIMAFLKAYRPQPFPAPIDAQAAARGAGVYASQCASCHGSYRHSSAGPRLVRFPNWIGDVGTDRLRATAFDKALAEGVAKTAYRDRIAVATGRGYVAPPLTGLWASAPYLHNGSVPTLAALLSPGERPARFMVGGHALDVDTVGLRLGPDGAYPAGYVPFSTPAWIDTAATGRGNQGHRFGEALAPADKQALIAYLKRL